LSFLRIIASKLVQELNGLGLKVLALENLVRRLFFAKPAKIAITDRNASHLLEHMLVARQLEGIFVKLALHQVAARVF
jgi:hypothetical protein